ncbi:D-threonine aldolase [Planctomycetes bacterium Poly30]|uniref:D-threonine aldolase n=1 Tax=Saltatorellus ferox TaxID=2528018 RepID=A0A518EPB5_9BACT|nr:D-threonine aldolase [Planctomycetes bacterium Poly30]
MTAPLAPVEASLPAPWHGLLTPALIIDLGRARRNIAATLERVGGPDRWRPHVKTVKVPEVMSLYLDAGVLQFKCATLKEAEVLASCRSASGDVAAVDILVAHHLFGPALARLGELAAEFPSVRFSTLVEASEQVEGIPGAVGVFADLDLGMNRTGLSVEDLEALETIARAAGSRFGGLHAYDGHMHDPDGAKRERMAHRCYDRLVGAHRHLADAGLEPGELITSGTPSYPAALNHRVLKTLPHRVSPGTVVYHDLRTREQLADHAIEFAAIVLTRVASLPGEDLFTVDAGSKAIEAATPTLIAAALEWPNAVAIRQSEEHTVFQVKDGKRPKRGDLLRLVPGHVCPTVNLASDCVLTDGDDILGVAHVSARGHQVARR